MSHVAEHSRERDRRFHWHTWTPLDADRSELMLSHGAGYRVTDVAGRSYLDASALNSTCGYAHPDVVRAVAEQAGRLHFADVAQGSHPLAGALAERLSSYLPGGPHHTLFVNSGSEGFDAALLMAAAYHEHLGRPRRRIVSLADGYQGATLLSRSLSKLPRNRHALRPPMPATMVDLPAPAAGMRRPEALPALLDAFERAIGADPDDLPAAVVVEPFLNVGGGVVLPDGFLRELAARCTASGTLLLVDEVFTAYGRCSRMFALEREGVAADIVVSSKGLAGGYVPIAAVSVAQHVRDTFRADPVIGGLRYGHTTSGHPVACAAALAVLDVIEKEGLLDRAALLGPRMLDGLADLRDVPGVTDVRGYGLITVVELADEEAATAAQAEARHQGLLLRRQRNALMPVPALVIDDAGVEEVLDGTRAAVTAVLTVGRGRHAA